MIDSSLLNKAYFLIPKKILKKSSKNLSFRTAQTFEDISVLLGGVGSAQFSNFCFWFVFQELYTRVPYPWIQETIHHSGTAIVFLSSFLKQ